MRLESIPCLIEPIFPKVGLIAIAGCSDTGKSNLMRQLCQSIVAGESTFLGYKINAEHKGAIYVSTEDESNAMSRLLAMQNEGLKYPWSSMGNLHYLFDTSNLLIDIEALLKAYPIDLIVNDAFADVFSKDINQTNQVRSFLTDFSNLASTYKCLFVFIHHTGKASETKAPNKNSILGSQGFEARMRTVAMLTKHSSIANYRYFCIVKGNYLPDHMKNEAQELQFDEYMTFSLTGRHEMIENLSKDDAHKHKEELVLKLYGEGKSQSSIAKTLGLSQSTVSRIIGLVKYL
ncbi:MAG: AAA family ATPase [Verrucomicrobia bacterium]|nr:AAA family ATPase [Prolixibacteraceae bacterium]